MLCLIGFTFFSPHTRTISQFCRFLSYFNKHNWSQQHRLLNLQLLITFIRPFSARHWFKSINSFFCLSTSFSLWSVQTLAVRRSRSTFVLTKTSRQLVTLTMFFARVLHLSTKCSQEFRIFSQKPQIGDSEQKIGHLIYLSTRHLKAERYNKFCCWGNEIRVFSELFCRNELTQTLNSSIW